MPGDQNLIKPTTSKEVTSPETEISAEKVEQVGQKEIPTTETEAVKIPEQKVEQTEQAPVGLPQIKQQPKIEDVPLPADELTLEIEKIMEDGLGEAWQEMTPIQRQEFKIEGERTAKQIRELLKATHVKIKKVFRLLLDWLKIIPGVNRFFLEQEAKIKADKIMALSRMRSHHR